QIAVSGLSMRQPNPHELPLCAPAVVIVIHSDRETDDVAWFGVTDGLERYAKFRVVTCVSNGGFGKPGRGFSVTRITSLHFAIRVVGRDHELAAGADDFRIGAGGIAGWKV